MNKSKLELYDVYPIPTRPGEYGVYVIDDEGNKWYWVSSHRTKNQAWREIDRIHKEKWKR